MHPTHSTHTTAGISSLASRRTSDNYRHFEVKRPPAGLREPQSPSTTRAHITAFQLERLASQEPREKNASRKALLGKGSPIDNVPPAGTRGSLSGIQSHAVTVETTEPAVRPSQAGPLPSSRHGTSRHFPCNLSRGVAPKKRQSRQDLPGTLP